MTNKQKKEEIIYDFIFNNLDPYNGNLAIDEEDIETYTEDSDGINYYKRLILMYDKEDFEGILQKLEKLTDKEYVRDFNYLNCSYKLDNNILMVFRNIQERVYLKTIEVLITYNISKQELRNDLLEEILL